MSEIVELLCLQNLAKNYLFSQEIIDLARIKKNQGLLKMEGKFIRLRHFKH